MVATESKVSNPALVVENLEARIELALRERRIEDADRYISQLNIFVAKFIREESVPEPIVVKRIPNPQPNWERIVIFLLSFVAGLELGIWIRPILVRWMNGSVLIWIWRFGGLILALGLLGLCGEIVGVGIPGAANLQRHCCIWHYVESVGIHPKRKEISMSGVKDIAVLKFAPHINCDLGISIPEFPPTFVRYVALNRVLLRLKRLQQDRNLQVQILPLFWLESFCRYSDASFNAYFKGDSCTHIHDFQSDLIRPIESKFFEFKRDNLDQRLLFVFHHFNLVASRFCAGFGCGNRFSQNRSLFESGLGKNGEVVGMYPHEISLRGNGNESEYYRPCRDPFRPCQEYVPPLRAGLALLCLFAGIYFACEGIRSRGWWALLMAFYVVTMAAGIVILLVSGHQYDCGNQSDPTEYRQSFPHNSGIVPHKPLDTL